MLNGAVIPFKLYQVLDTNYHLPKWNFRLPVQGRSLDTEYTYTKRLSGLKRQKRPKRFSEINRNLHFHQLVRSDYNKLLIKSTTGH